MTPSKLSVPLPILLLLRPQNNAGLAWLNVEPAFPRNLPVTCRLSAVGVNGRPSTSSAFFSSPFVAIDLLYTRSRQND